MRAAGKWGRLRCIAARCLLLAVVAGLSLPAATILVLGVVFSPVLLLSVLGGQAGNAMALLLLAGGGWGLLALLQLTWQVGWPRGGQRFPRWGLLAGGLAHAPLLSSWPNDLGQAWFQGGVLVALLLLCGLRHVSTCARSVPDGMSPAARGQG